jgi:hypothetical protein
MSTIGSGISLRGIYQELFNYPFKISGSPVAADVGKAVSLDAGAANTVKLAADGDPILGILMTLEDRVVEGVKICTVATKGGHRLQVVSGGSGAISVGSEVQGAGAGEVKVNATQLDTDGVGTPTIRGGTHQKRNIVVEKISTTHVVILLH